MTESTSNQTPEYQKLYKDAKRIVVYADPKDKAILAQHALDKGLSLSELCEPVLRKLARGIKQG